MAESQKRGRRKGQTSREIAKAARRNGRKRRRDQLPATVLQRLGAPPHDPDELRTWNARLLAELVWLLCRGELGPELAASLRASAGALERALPAQWADTPDASDEPTGPALDNADDEGGIRVE